MMKLKAYAKINLTLEILGTKRNDGFHDIKSVMHKVTSLYDEVTLEKAPDITLNCDADVCAPYENLAYRAAKAYLDGYEKCTGKSFGVHIDLTKKIPSGAGLAGGSADCAAVLRGLYSMFGGLEMKELFNIALCLGSDVPFCLSDYTCALCEGRGEIMTELKPLPTCSVEIEKPSGSLSTKGIYGEYDRLYGDDYAKFASDDMARALYAGDLERVCSLCRNDFEPICIKRLSEIREIKEKMYARGALVSQMSGSGSAVFGIFR